MWQSTELKANIAETGYLNSQHWPHDQTEHPEGQQRRSDHAHLALHYESARLRIAKSSDVTIWYTASVTAYRLTLGLHDLETFHSAPPPVGGYQTAGDLATPKNLSVSLQCSLYRTRHVVITGKTNVLGGNDCLRGTWHAIQMTYRDKDIICNCKNLQDWLPWHWRTGTWLLRHTLSIAWLAVNVPLFSSGRMTLRPWGSV